MIDILTRFQPITCCARGCGITFALTGHHMDELRRSHAIFHCPAAHSQSFTGESDAEKATRMERLRDEERKRRFDAEIKHRSEITSLERRRRATAGHLTRTKNRIAHGVCPCCKRTFSNVARHMKGQHPSYVETAKEAE